MNNPFGSNHRHLNRLSRILAGLVLCGGTLTWIMLLVPATAKETPPQEETCHQKESQLHHEFKTLINNDQLTPEEVAAKSEAFKQRFDVLATCPPQYINRLTNFMARTVKKELHKLNAEKEKTRR